MSSESLLLNPRETRLVVGGAMISLFLAALDQTIVATALPSISSDLGDVHLMSWIVTASGGCLLRRMLRSRCERRMEHP